MNLDSRTDSEKTTTIQATTVQATTVQAEFYKLYTYQLKRNTKIQKKKTFLKISSENF